MFIVSALSNIGAEIRCLMSQKLNHLASSVCLLMSGKSNVPVAYLLANEA